jgi:hypothetical protein
MTPIEPALDSAAPTNASPCLPDDPEIKKLQIQIDSAVIWRKALDLISKRLESGEMSDTMLLRTVACLGQSTLADDLPRRPRRRRRSKYDSNGNREATRANRKSH